MLSTLPVQGHTGNAGQLPVKLDHEAMIRDVLAGRGLKPPNEYKR